MENNYDLIYCSDVWGNAKDGWTVNNQCIEATDLHIEPDMTDKEILNFLVSIGFLSTSDRRRVGIEDDGTVIEIYEVKGHKPLGVLMPVA